MARSAPDKDEDQEDGNDGGEEEKENTAETEEAEGEQSGHVLSKPPALKVCRFSFNISHLGHSYHKLVSLSKATESLPATDNVGAIVDEEEKGTTEDQMEEEKKDEKKEKKKKEAPKNRRNQAPRSVKPKFSLAD